MNTYCACRARHEVESPPDPSRIISDTFCHRSLISYRSSQRQLDFPDKTPIFMGEVRLQVLPSQQEDHEVRQPDKDS